MVGSAEPRRAPEHLDLTESADVRERTPTPRAEVDGVLVVPARQRSRRRTRVAGIAAAIARIIRRAAAR
ncbi:hypothetical protein [Dactylosporangium sp. CA-139066]|uniref:hypothetical protein n=1 Tax=Dactylosporangium sp. CA-139066 TaxID=3239930 RepID=UPI003D8F0FE4